MPHTELSLIRLVRMLLVLKALDAIGFPVNTDLVQHCHRIPSKAPPPPACLPPPLPPARKKVGNFKTGVAEQKQLKQPSP